MKETLVGILVLVVFGGLLFGLCMIPVEIFYFSIWGLMALYIVLYTARAIGREVCQFLERRKWKGRENER